MNKIIISNTKGYEPLLINPNYKINIGRGLVINKNNKLLAQHKITTNKLKNPYLSITINNKSYKLHRLVWMHKHGEIPQDKVIDHMDNNPANNSIYNLQCITTRENVLRSLVNRDMTYLSKKGNESCRKNGRKVEAIDMTDENAPKQLFKSVYEAGMKLKINAGIVYSCCNKINNSKTGFSKLNNHQYKFEYIV
jgi:hypothetical protein